MQELQLGPRLALEVQDLLGAIVDVDERLALVVLRHQLAGPRRDAEPEHARAGIRRREAHAHRRRLAVDRQLHLLRSDDAAFVLDVERHRLAGVAGLRHERVDHQRRALERRRAASTRDRSGRPSSSDSRPRPTVNTGTSAAFIASSASGELGVGRVGAVGHDDEPGQRQPGELLPRAVERRAELRLRAGERRAPSATPGAARSTRSGSCAARTGSTASCSDVGLGRREVLLDERAARLAVDVGDLHAARVVDEHAEEVLLRDGRLDDEHGPEQAEEDERAASRAGSPPGPRDAARCLALRVRR